MIQTQLQNIEKLEADLWEAADNLRANSKLTSSEYCMPVLGVIFLRHATNRYDAALNEIEADQAAGKMPKRPLTAADFQETPGADAAARKLATMDCSHLPKGANLGDALVKAMNAIERDFEPLLGQLPKDYGKFENQLARRPDARFQQREAPHGHRRRVRPHLRILPDEVLHAGRAGQRRVLHAALARADHRQRHRAGPRHGVRSGLRLGRHVRAVEPLHRAARPATRPSASTSSARKKTQTPSASPR